MCLCLLSVLVLVFSKELDCWLLCSIHFLPHVFWRVCVLYFFSFRFGGETAPAACAVQVCALEPPTPELPLDPARLGEAVLRRMVLADSRGGVPARRDVLQSVNRSVGALGAQELMNFLLPLLFLLLLPR